MHAGSWRRRWRWPRARLYPDARAHIASGISYVSYRIRDRDIRAAKAALAMGVSILLSHVVYCIYTDVQELSAKRAHNLAFCASATLERHVEIASLMPSSILFCLFFDFRLFHILRRHRRPISLFT